LEEFAKDAIAQTGMLSGWTTKVKRVNLSRADSGSGEVL
jgi:hypothetical protein